MLFPMVILAITDDSDRSYMMDLFIIYSGLMYKEALSIVRDHHTAEDMVADSCVKIIDQLDRVKKINECKLRSYLVSIVRNVSINYVVKRDRRSRFSFLTEDDSVFHSVANEHEVDEDILRKTDEQMLKQGLMMLPENERNLLRMKYFDRLSDREIAVVLSVKPDSIRSYLTKSRRHLKAILDGGDIGE